MAGCRCRLVGLGLQGLGQRNRYFEIEGRRNFEALCWMRGGEMEEEDGCQGVESRSSCGCGLMLLCVCVSRCVCVCMEEERRIVVSVCLLFARICVLLYLQYTTVRKALRALVWSRAVVGS